ncbi:MAG: RNA polymerase-binding protein DksA [Polaromonas sp.]|nr:RNA polymerase-binding protein DksA [Polaromonas sp.]
MKANAKKSTTPAKAAVKTALKSTATAKPAAKTVPTAVNAKAVVNAAPAKKPVVKLAPKAASSKVAVKPATAKSIAAPKSGKPVAKPVAKSAVKPVVKSAVKPVVKAVVKVTAKNPVSAAKTTPEKTIKSPLNPTPKQPSATVTPAKTTKTSLAPAAPKLAPTPSPVPRPAEKSMLIPTPPALKPGRRSSTRAPSHLPPPAPMVPTHAPDAAKASYSTMTERVIAPPPHVAAKKDPKLANNWKTTAADQLTDDEVKAMPDSEYMNDKQMAFFRHRLSILKQDIHNSAGETTEHLREDTVVVPDPADRATIEEEHALELRTRDRERKLLKKIEQSIARIDSGDYGYCDETGEPIGVGRLIARPTANLSLEAQQRRELKQKMFGD